MLGDSASDSGFVGYLRHPSVGAHSTVDNSLVNLLVVYSASFIGVENEQ